MEHNQGVTPAGPGCQPTASAAEGASSLSGIPNAAELAVLCEEMPDANRELDVLIAVVIDWRWDDWEEGESTARGQAEKHGIDWLIGRATKGMASMWRHMPRYTASLDAAMSLVPGAPKNWRRSRFELAHGSGDPAWFAKLLYVGPPTNLIDAHGIAATPALALCAAALKARAAIADAHAKRRDSTQIEAPSVMSGGGAEGNRT